MMTFHNNYFSDLYCHRLIGLDIALSRRRLRVRVPLAVQNPTITALSMAGIFSFEYSLFQRKVVSSGFGWALPNGQRTACIGDW